MAARTKAQWRAIERAVRALNQANQALGQLPAETSRWQVLAENSIGGPVRLTLMGLQEGIADAADLLRKEIL